MRLEHSTTAARFAKHCGAKNHCGTLCKAQGAVNADIVRLEQRAESTTAELRPMNSIRAQGGLLEIHTWQVLEIFGLGFHL